MSKRKYSAISSGLPYSTNDGGRWLRKALDPADVDVDIIGMPDCTTNARTVLNYQMQADIPIPDTDTFVATNVSSYDADLYLYQGPIIYGMSASYPQGTKDISSAPINVDFLNFTIGCAAGTAPRTVNVFINDQIEGSTYSAKLDNFTTYCQRSRMIYGGVQAIPACSALFDSGTIEATQQIFNPENSNVFDVSLTDRTQIPDHLLSANPTVPEVRITDGKVYKKQKFRLNDFPDSGNTVQNPAALYCRYKEGCYMPYKIFKPLDHPYCNSEERAIVESPYIMTNIGYYSYFIDEQVTSDQRFPTYLSTGRHTGVLDYDPNTRTFKPAIPLTNANETFYWTNNIAFYIKCYNKCAVPFWMRFSYSHVITTGNGTAWPAFGENGDLPKSYNFSVPALVPAYHNLDPIVKEIGNHFEDQNNSFDNIFRIDIYNAQIENTDTIPEKPTFILPFAETNLGVVNFRSIGVQASVRLIFRIGIEMLITAGGVYSPFKHKAPKYDEKAINTYIRACHNMRDAFLGNAATPEGHLDYSSNINSIVSSYSNPGTGWYGRVSV